MGWVRVGPKHGFGKRHFSRSILSRTGLWPVRDKIDLEKCLPVRIPEKPSPRSEVGLNLRNAGPPELTPAAYFNASIGAGGVLKRSKPRRTVRRGLLPFKHRCGTVGVGCFSCGRIPFATATVLPRRSAARPLALLLTPPLLHSLSPPPPTAATRWLQRAERVAPSGAERCGGGARRFLLVTEAVFGSGTAGSGLERR